MLACALYIQSGGGATMQAGYGTRAARRGRMVTRRRRTQPTWDNGYQNPHT